MPGDLGRHEDAVAQYADGAGGDDDGAAADGECARVDGGPKQRAGVSGECGVGVGEEAGWLVQEEVS